MVERLESFTPTPVLFSFLHLRKSERAEPQVLTSSSSPSLTYEERGPKDQVPVSLAAPVG